MRGNVAKRHKTFNIRVSVYFSGTLNLFYLTRQCHIPAFIKIQTHRTRFEIKFATLFLSTTYVMFNSSRLCGCGVGVVVVVVGREVPRKVCQ